MGACGKFFKLLILVNPFFCVFYLPDVIGAVGIYFERMNITSEHVGMFYVAYSSLTPFLNLASGFMVDKIGYEITTGLILVMILAGSSIVTVAMRMYYNIAFSSFMLLMIIGRVLTGVCECFVVVQNTLLGANFSGGWLTFAFSLSNVWGQFGKVAVFMVLPFIADINIVTAVGTGVVTVLFSIVTCVGYIIWDQMQKSKNPPPKPPPISLADIKNLDVRMWMMNMINMLSTVSFFICCSFGPLILYDDYGYTPEEAGLIVAIMNLTIVIAPIAGWLLDYFGYRAHCWTVTLFLMTVGYVVPANQLFDPAWIWILQAAGFSIVNSSVNAAVSLVVPVQILGTAYGLVGLFFNLGLLLYQMFVTVLRSRGGSWGLFFWMLFLLNIICCMCSMIILATDKDGKVKNGTRHQKKNYKETG